MRSFLLSFVTTNSTHTQEESALASRLAKICAVVVDVCVPICCIMHLQRRLV